MTDFCESCKRTIYNWPVFRWFLGLSINKKASLLLIPVLVIISLANTYDAIRTERSILNNELLHRGEAIAMIAAKHAELPILSENMELLNSSARALREIKDVTFVVFYKKDFTSLLSEGVHSNYRPHSALKQEQVQYFERETYFEFYVPIFTYGSKDALELFSEAIPAGQVRQHVGWVLIGLSKEVIKEGTRVLMYRSLWYASLFTVGGSLLMYALISITLRPVRMLLDAVKALKEGEYSEINTSPASDEIAHLTVEFNRMSRAIKEREGELIRHRDHLEELVNERTAQLTIAKEQAELASRAKSDFLSSMSHELRTPLNAILGYAQILKRQENLNETQQQQLGIMRESGEHLLMLINDILDVGKIEARKMDIADKPFDLQALMRQVFNLIRLHAEEKELQFQYEVITTLPQYVQGDERKLRQILLNLLNNAVKYTSKGGVILRVIYDYSGNGLLRCEVIDTGIGIPQDKLEAVFEQFTQVASNRQVREGTGLGLNITRLLLTLMQGRIGVVSTVGSGSTFWMELPLPQVADLEIAPEMHQQSIIGYQGERRNILVVDDNINNTSMLVSLLDSIGFAVSTAENGRVALQQASKHYPDLVILDLVMPEMDGLESAMEMRKRPELSGTKIIGASAAVTDSTCKEAFVALCDAFVAKPIQIELLLERIREQLGITWNRSSPELPLYVSTAGADGSVAAFDMPPHNELKILHELALRGDVRRIQIWATQMENNDPKCRLFTGKLRELAGSYRTKAILALLDEHSGDEK